MQQPLVLAVLIFCSYTFAKPSDPLTIHLNVDISTNRQHTKNESVEFDKGLTNRGPLNGKDR